MYVCMYVLLCVNRNCHISQLWLLKYFVYSIYSFYWYFEDEILKIEWNFHFLGNDIIYVSIIFSKIVVNVSRILGDTHTECKKMQFSGLKSKTLILC